MDIPAVSSDSYYIPGLHTSIQPLVVLPAHLGSKFVDFCLKIFNPFSKNIMIHHDAESDSAESDKFSALVDFSDVAGAKSRLGRGIIYVSENSSESDQTYSGMIINVHVPDIAKCISNADGYENAKVIGESQIGFVVNENDAVVFQLHGLNDSNPVVYSTICCENDDECEKLQKELVDLNDEFVPSFINDGDKAVRAIRGPEFGLVAISVMSGNKAKNLAGIKAFVKKVDSSTSLFGQKILSKTYLDKLVVQLSCFTGEFGPQSLSNDPNVLKNTQTFVSEMKNYAALINSNEETKSKIGDGLGIVPTIIAENPMKIVEFFVKALDGDIVKKLTDGSFMIEFGANTGYSGMVEIKESNDSNPANSMSISLAVPNLDQVFEKVKGFSNEIKVEFPPSDCKWGEKMAIIGYESVQVTLFQYHGNFSEPFLNSDYNKWCNDQDPERAKKIPFAPRGYGRVTATIETSGNIQTCSNFFNEFVFEGKSKQVLELKKQQQIPQSDEGNKNGEEKSNDQANEDEVEVIILTSKNEDVAIVIKKKEEGKSLPQIHQNPRLMKYFVKDSMTLFEKMKSEGNIVSGIAENGNGELCFTVKDPTGNYATFSSMTSRMNFSNLTKNIDISLLNDSIGKNEESCLDTSSASTDSNKRPIDDAERNESEKDQENYESEKKKSKTSAVATC